MGGWQTLSFLKGAAESAFSKVMGAFRCQVVPVKCFFLNRKF